MDSRKKFSMELDTASIFDKVSNPSLPTGCALDERGYLYNTGESWKNNPVRYTHEFLSQGKAHLSYPFRKLNLRVYRNGNFYIAEIGISSKTNPFCEHEKWRTAIDLGLRRIYGSQYSSYPAGGYIMDRTVNEPLISIDAELDGITVISGAEGCRRRSIAQKDFPAFISPREIFEEDIRTLGKVASEIINLGINQSKARPLNVILGF